MNYILVLNMNYGWHYGIFSNSTQKWGVHPLSVSLHIIYKCSFFFFVKFINAPWSSFLALSFSLCFAASLSAVLDPPPNASTKQSFASLGLLYCRSLSSYYSYTRSIVFGSIRDFVISIDPKRRDSLLPIWSRYDLQDAIHPYLSINQFFISIISLWLKFAFYCRLACSMTQRPFFYVLNAINLPTFYRCMWPFSQ